jgi:hypothetical protein
MTVDAILALVDKLTPIERTVLLDRLRDRYDNPEPPAGPSPRTDQTGVYSVDQLIDRARRSG